MICSSTRDQSRQQTNDVLFRDPGAPHLFDGGERSVGERIRSQRRVQEGQTANPGRVLGGEQLGDHAPHAPAQQACCRNAEVVHQGGQIVGHLSERVRLVGRARAARAPVVERDDPEVLAEFGQVEAPGLQLGTESADEDDRLSLPGFLEVGGERTTL